RPRRKARSGYFGRHQNARAQRRLDGQEPRSAYAGRPAGRFHSRESRRRPRDCRGFRRPSSTLRRAALRFKRQKGERQIKPMTKAKPKSVAKQAVKPKTKANARTNAMSAITPHLVCAGATKAIDFYKKAFGAKEVMRLDGPSGKLAHACVEINGAHVMLCD